MSKKKVFSGSLDFISLPDIFQILGGNGSSGVLKMESRNAPHTGVIYFRKGDPINAKYGPDKGIEALYSMFGWTDGEYSFREENVSHINRMIKQGRMEIVLDAMRMLDDGKIIKVGARSFDETKGHRTAQADVKQGPPVIKGPLLDYMHVIREDFYNDGEKIVEEGKHGKWIWAIYKGTVSVSTKTDNGSIIISRLGEGCFIGTVRALLFGEYERSATVTAEGDVQLCLLDSVPFHHEYASLSHNFRSLLLSLDGRLRELNKKAIECYTRKNSDRGFQKGFTPYVHKEIPQKELFSITEGTAQIVRQGPKGHLPLVSLNKNDIFGDIPFLDLGHEPRSASVLASRDLKTEKLDIQELTEEYDNLSDTFRNLIYNIGMYISMTTNLVDNYYNEN